MRRVVLDANVYVSALLAPTGSPAQILEGWADGQFDVIVSPLLLAELERVLRRPKFKNKHWRHSFTLDNKRLSQLSLGPLISAPPK